ncbi:MAG: hypothetical protein P1R58_06255 [bacterium]|nr:hypothetical protein [bacterium]
MRKTITLFLGLVFILSLSGMALAAPRLTIEESTFNFGFVPQHSKVSHSFVLRSTGDDTLKIVKVVPG